MIYLLSLLLLPGLAQLDVLDLVDLLGIYDELGVERVQLLRLLQVLGGRLVVLQCLEGEGSPEEGVAVLGLQSNDLGVIVEGLLEVVGEEVALGPFVDVAGLVVGQLNGLGEVGDRLFVHLAVGVGDAQVVVNVGLVGLEGLVVERSVQVLHSLLELLVPVEGQPPLVEYLRVSRPALEGVRQILYCLSELPHIHVDIAPLHQEILVLGLPLQCVVQVVKGSLEVLHQTLRLPYPLVDPRILGAKFEGVQKIVYGILVGTLSEFPQLHL